MAKKAKPGAELPTCNCALLCDDVLENSAVPQTDRMLVARSESPMLAEIKVRWIKLPDHTTLPTLSSLNKWFEQNAARVARGAEENCRRLTGKASL